MKLRTRSARRCSACRSSRRFMRQGFNGPLAKLSIKGSARVRDEQDRTVQLRALHATVKQRFQTEIVGARHHINGGAFTGGERPVCRRQGRSKPAGRQA